MLTAVVAAVVVLTALRVTVPSDLATWSPAALPGEAVFALLPTEDGMLAATAQGLSALDADGGVRDLGVRGRVATVVQERGGLLLGTEQGLLSVPPTGGPARTVAFPGVAVHRLSEDAGGLWAATDTGLHRRDRTGSWSRTWPRSGQPDRSVPAVLAVEAGALFAHPDGVGLVDGSSGAVEVVHPGVRVVSLSAVQTDDGATQLWAGLFGPPLLLLSVDGGRRWQPRSSGLGFVAVNTVVADPSAAGRLVAGGSGIADGTGNAGTQTSDDAGRSWQVEQGRLSNTHVFALHGRREPVDLRVRLAGLPGSFDVALPFETGRVYAGTNGGGVYTARPDVPLLRFAAPAAPALRLLEPLAAGLALLLCLVPAFAHLQRRGRPRRSPDRTDGTTTHRHDDHRHDDHRHDDHSHEETA